jgi:iron(III) transport system substrate-binding protein
MFQMRTMRLEVTGSRRAKTDAKNGFKVLDSDMHIMEPSPPATAGVRTPGRSHMAVDMKTFPVLAASIAALLLAACASQAQPSVSAQAQQKGNWNDVVAQANKEGNVVVIGSGSDVQRTALTETFMKRYPQIKVDYTLMASSAPTPKLLAEHSANKVETDVVIIGVAGNLPLMDAQALAEIRPLLVGPDIDESKQLNGKWHIADNAGKYILIFSAYVKLAWAYPPDKVDASQFTNWKDMLDPKWKGKIIMGDPTSPGAGGAMAAYWYQSPELGKSFVDQFFKQQDATFSRDDNQMINSVARGQHLIGIGIADSILVASMAKDLPIKAHPAAQLAQKPYVTAGNGGLTVMKSAPHPNATKVYLNWLLSAEGQGQWEKSNGVPSLRQDAPHEGLLDVMVPKPGREYYETQREDFARHQAEAGQYVKTLVGG